MAQVGILMGSDSDWPTMRAAATTLRDFAVPCEVRVISAHRRPDDCGEYARSAAQRGLKVLIAGAGLLYCFMDARFRSSPVHIIAGVGVGLCAVAGWALTGLAYDDFATRPTPPISLTYVRPAGDALEWLQRYTAAPLPGFGVASVFGALLGAGATALAMGRFRISTFSDSGDTLRNLLGALLMGIGGVMALGCTVGQAITGISTLALGSFLTFGAIIAGGVYGLHVLERRIMAGG